MVAVLQPPPTSLQAQRNGKLIRINFRKQQMLEYSTIEHANTTINQGREQCKLEQKSNNNQWYDNVKQTKWVVAIVTTTPKVRLFSRREAMNESKVSHRKWKSTKIQQQRAVTALRPTYLCLVQQSVFGDALQLGRIGIYDRRPRVTTKKIFEVPDTLHKILRTSIRQPFYDIRTLS